MQGVYRFADAVHVEFGESAVLETESKALEVAHSPHVVGKNIFVLVCIEISRILSSHNLPTCTTYPVHVIRRDFIILMIFGEQFNL